jgi:2-hydroxy-6-oxonona-2,4-dienedioate hydrolase
MHSHDPGQRGGHGNGAARLSGARPRIGDARSGIGARHRLTRRGLLRTGSGVAALIAANGVCAPLSWARTPTATAAEDAPVSERQGTLRSTRVWVDGVPFHTLVAVDRVPATAPAVVLVHGLGLSGRYMIPTAEALAPTHRVYLPDLPGFGDSGKPERALDVPGLADALAAWMPAAGLERAMLLGNSFGCQIIGDLAARYPERVERAVLQGPTAPPDERSWLWQFIRWQQNSPHNPPAMGDIAQADYLKTGPVRLFLTFQFSLEDRLEDKLPRIRAPMLVVRGALDPICNQEWAAFVARRLPRGQLVVIPDVAHTLVYTAAPELVAASLPFLQGTA